MRCASAPSLMRPTKPVPLSKETYANDNGDIRLQNLKTRIIVVCRESFTKLPKPARNSMKRTTMSA